MHEEIGCVRKSHWQPRRIDKWKDRKVEERVIVTRPGRMLHQAKLHILPPVEARQIHIRMTGIWCDILMLSPLFCYLLKFSDIAFLLFCFPSFLETG